MCPQVKARALVMHGTLDEVIHISCAQKLHSLLPNAAEPLWAEGFNHQNLEMCGGYLPRLQAFIGGLAAGSDARR